MTYRDRWEDIKIQILKNTARLLRSCLYKSGYPALEGSGHKSGLEVILQGIDINPSLR